MTVSILVSFTMRIHVIRDHAFCGQSMALFAPVDNKLPMVLVPLKNWRAGKHVVNMINNYHTRATPTVAILSRLTLHSFMLVCWQTPSVRRNLPPHSSSVALLTGQKTLAMLLGEWLVGQNDIS